jgi:hypothetical protein
MQIRPYSLRGTGNDRELNEAIDSPCADDVNGSWDVDHVVDLKTQSSFVNFGLNPSLNSFSLSATL